MAILDGARKSHEIALQINQGMTDVQSSDSMIPMLIYSRWVLPLCAGIFMSGPADAAPPARTAATARTASASAPAEFEACKRLVDKIEREMRQADASEVHTLQGCQERFSDELAADASLAGRLEKLLSPPPASDLQSARSIAVLALEGEGLGSTADERSKFDDYIQRATRSRLASLSKSGVDPSSAVPDKVVEFFSILADVAVKRAKKNGLAYLQERLSSRVCEVKLVNKSEGREIVLLFGKNRLTGKLNTADAAPFPDSASPPAPAPAKSTGTSSSDKLEGTPEIALFPDTCALLKVTSLERIASEPEVLASAVTSDLTAVLVYQMIEQLDLEEGPGPTLKQYLHLARVIAGRVLRTKDFSIQASDVNLIVDTLIADHLGAATKWGKTTVVIGLGGLAYAIVLAEGELQELAATDVPKILAELCPTTSDQNGAPKCSLEERLEASQLTSLGIKAITAVDSSGEGDIEARIKAGVQLVFAVAHQVVDEQRRPALDGIETLVLAALDRDIPRALASAARLLKMLAESQSNKCAGEGRKVRGDEGCKSVHKYKYEVEELTTLLSSIATYASTYLAPAEGQAELSAKELRAARTAAIESAIDVFTNRNRRHGAWVGSLGLPVGFSMGGQSFRTADAPHRLGAPQGMPPQLSLPLGLAVQRLPGHHHRNGGRPDGKFFFDGFHAMATLIDLGQFVAYDADGDITKPTWNTFLSLGGQVGWLVGSPSNSFVIAADVRYGPSLFKSGDGSSMGDQPGGALRFGLFVAYYVPLFDFN